MSDLPSCSVCDKLIDAWGRDGTRCDRCYEPCQVCGGDVMMCAHPLAEQLTEAVGDPLLNKRRAA